MTPPTTRVRRSVRAPRSYTVAVPGYRCRHGHTALDDEHQSSRRISTFARTTSSLCGTAPVATAGHPVPHSEDAEAVRDEHRRLGDACERLVEAGHPSPRAPAFLSRPAPSGWLPAAAGDHVVCQSSDSGPNQPSTNSTLMVRRHPGGGSVVITDNSGNLPCLDRNALFRYGLDHIDGRVAGPARRGGARSGLTGEILPFKFPLHWPIPSARLASAAGAEPPTWAAAVGVEKELA